MFAEPDVGQKLFKEKHCALCHNIHNPGTVFAPVCPGLKGVRRAMLGETAAKVYGFELADLAAHARRVGPLPDEI